MPATLPPTGRLTVNTAVYKGLWAHTDSLVREKSAGRYRCGLSERCFAVANSPSFIESALTNSGTDQEASPLLQHLPPDRRSRDLVRVNGLGPAGAGREGRRPAFLVPHPVKHGLFDRAGLRALWELDTLVELPASGSVLAQPRRAHPRDSNLVGAQDRMGHEVDDGRTGPVESVDRACRARPNALTDQPEPPCDLAATPQTLAAPGCSPVPIRLQRLRPGKPVPRTSGEASGQTRTALGRNLRQLSTHLGDRGRFLVARLVLMRLAMGPSIRGVDVKPLSCRISM